MNRNLQTLDSHPCFYLHKSFLHSHLISSITYCIGIINLFCRWDNSQWIRLCPDWVCQANQKWMLRSILFFHLHLCQCLHVSLITCDGLPISQMQKQKSSPSKNGVAPWLLKFMSCNFVLVWLMRVPQKQQHFPGDNKCIHQWKFAFCEGTFTTVAGCSGNKTPRHGTASGASVNAIVHNVRKNAHVKRL